MKPVTDISPAEWDEVFTANVRSMPERQKMSVLELTLPCPRG